MMIAAVVVVVVVFREEEEGMEMSDMMVVKVRKIRLQSFKVLWRNESVTCGVMRRNNSNNGVCGGGCCCDCDCEAVEEEETMVPSNAVSVAP